MKWIGCIFFIFITLIYIWNGKDLFNKNNGFWPG